MLTSVQIGILRENDDRLSQKHWEWSKITSEKQQHLSLLITCTNSAGTTTNLVVSKRPWTPLYCVYMLLRRAGQLSSYWRVRPTRLNGISTRHASVYMSQTRQTGSTRLCRVHVNGAILAFIRASRIRQTSPPEPGRVYVNCATFT